MRVFVFEFVTGGGCAGDRMVASLATEGDMMLAAVVRDLLATDGVEVIVCRDRRLDMPPFPIEVDWVDLDWRASWARCLEGCDAVLPIAPETDGLLESLCRTVEFSGKLLLNSGADAVALAASKQATIERLAEQGIPVVSSWWADHLPRLSGTTLVMKPDMGAGCQDIHLVSDERALGDFLARQADPTGWLAQHYVEGRAASLSLMVGTGCVCLLGSNLQRIAQVDDGFMLLGCIVNGLTEARNELLDLAQALCGAMPGLWGYVGVDFIMTEHGPIVLEVNPRLTTSYVGLSQSTGRNVGSLMLQLVDDPGVLPAGQVPGDRVHVDLELGRVA